MKKRLIILATILAMSVMPLAACGQNDSNERNRIKIQEEKSYETPVEEPPQPETCPDACPDCGDSEDVREVGEQSDSLNDNLGNSQAPDESPNPQEMPPEFIKPPELKRNFRDRMPKRIGTFGFVIIMPSPEPLSNARNMPSPEGESQEIQDITQENS